MTKKSWKAVKKTSRNTNVNSLKSCVRKISGVTVRKRSCVKVTFSQTCVKNSVHAGCTPLPGQTPTPGQTLYPPPPADGSCSGRYASYWNASLFTKLYYLKIIGMNQNRKVVKKGCMLFQLRQHLRSLIIC